MSSTTEGTRSEGMVEQAKSELGDAAASAQEKAGELKEQGKGKLAETLDRRTNEVGKRRPGPLPRRCGRRARRCARRRDSAATQVAGLMEAAADQVEQLGGYLERTSGDRLLQDAEELRTATAVARRRHRSPRRVRGIQVPEGVVGAAVRSRYADAAEPGVLPARRAGCRWSAAPGGVRHGQVT